MEVGDATSPNSSTSSLSCARRSVSRCTTPPVTRSRRACHPIARPCAAAPG